MNAIGNFPFLDTKKRLSFPLRLSILLTVGYPYVCLVIEFPLWNRWFSDEEGRSQEPEFLIEFSLFILNKLNQDR